MIGSKKERGATFEHPNREVVVGPCLNWVS